MATLAFIFLAVAAVTNAFFGLVVFLRTYQRAYGWYFLITMMGVVLWTLGGIGLLLASDPQLVRLSAELFYIAPMLAPIFIWFFGISFPENRRVPVSAFIVAGGAFLTFGVLFLFNLDFFVKDVIIQEPLNSPEPAFPGFLLYAGFLSCFFTLAYITYILKIRKLHGLSRTQVVYTFWGLFFGSMLALISNLSLPMMGITSIVWLGPFVTLFFAGAVTAAIVRHGLFNIRLVLVRSIGYILSIASLAILYGLLTFTVINEFVFSNGPISTSQQVVFTLLAAMLAFTFQPVKRFFERVSNRLFYRDAYDPQTLMDHLNRSLVANNTELERMLKESAGIIQAYLKTDFCVFGIEDIDGGQKTIGTKDKQYEYHDIETVKHLTPRLERRVFVADTVYYQSRQDQLTTILRKNDTAILARLVPEHQRNKKAIGYLLLGNKKSGNPFTEGDVRMLEIIINELVIAIQNAMRFEEIKQFNRTLQEKVEDATKKLRQKNDRLRLLDQTKDDFISMASHQLRTPLTSVKGYISMVLDGDAGKITALQRKLLNQSFISSQRMVYLISDLLNVSRLRTGKFIIEPIETNLADVIESEVEQLKETAKSRDLTLTYHKPEHFPLLMLDENKLRQVIMNFIDNAIYYTPGGGHITVKLEDRPNAIEFTVIDDGIGVPKHEQHHLFGKFYRAHNAKRARPDGTGLGLFMAKKVIIAQGGATIFKSQEGKGSTFGFTFPKHKLLPKS